MPTRPYSVVIDAADPAGLARFWGEALGWPVSYETHSEVVVEVEGATAWGDSGVPPLVFVPVEEPKQSKNRVHLDLASDSIDGQRKTVRRLLDLGAREAEVGQRDVPWVVLTDPGGNEFCVLEPRERYLQAAGIAAVVLDCADAEALAPYWAAASGWPVTQRGPGYAAFAHPGGSGTWLELLSVPEAKVVKNRLHVDIAPRPDDDHEAEVARLEAAGAIRVDVGQGAVSWVVLADPQGGEHCVLTPR